MAGRRVRVMLVDDHELVREGLHLLLERSGTTEVVAEARDAATTLELAEAEQPDIVVLDVALNGEDGLSLIPGIRRVSPESRVVVLSMHNEPALARAALASGARCYVRKDAAPAELERAIAMAQEGGTYVDPVIGARLATEPTGRMRPPAELTARELDVLRLLALGQTNAEVADELHISVRTVEAHRSHLQQKTGLTARSALVRFAYQHGVLP